MHYIINFNRELFRRAANLASNEDLNKILVNTFIVLGHMFFRMHSYQVGKTKPIHTFVFSYFSS